VAVSPGKPYGKEKGWRSMSMSERELQIQKFEEICRLTAELAKSKFQLAAAQRELGKAASNSVRFCIELQRAQDEVKRLIKANEKLHAKCAEMRQHLVLPAINRKGFYCVVCNNGQPRDEGEVACTQDGTEKHSAECILAGDNPGAALLKELTALRRVRDALESLMSLLELELTGFPKNVPKSTWAEQWDVVCEALATCPKAKE